MKLHRYALPLAIAATVALLFQLFPDTAAALVPLAAFPLTTLSANSARVYELGDTSRHPIVADDIVYEGAAVGDNASGYGRPLVAGDKFLGFAKAKCDNTLSGPLAAAGAAGDLEIEVITRGEVLLTVSSAALTDHGRAVYASDDNAFTFTAAGNTFIGFVKRYDSTATKLVVAFDASQSGLAQTPLTASFTIAAQSGNGIAVVAQLKYLTGQVLAERRAVKVYISDNVNGDTQGPPAGGTDVTVAVGTDGLLIETLANSAGIAVSEADGDIDLTLTKVATGAETVYLVLIMPDGRLVVSDAITFT
jgi:hypothetical protein